MATLACAGCGGDGAATTATTASTAGTDADAQRLAHQVELTRGDLPRGYGPNVMQAGDVVDGQVSLDLCGADFPSEARRRARHQVGFEQVERARLVTSETVVYAPGGAAQAMAELRAARRSCTGDPTESLIDGVPAMAWQLTDVPLRPGWQPDTLALVVRGTPDGGNTLSATVIYQRRGDLISVLALHETPASDRLVAALGDILSERLERASP